METTTLDKKFKQEILNMKIRFIIICFFFIIGAWDIESADKLELVKDGMPQAELVIPAQANPREKAAGLLMVKYIGESTGAKIPVVSENELGKSPVKIYLGATVMARKYQEKLAKMLPDGYILDFPGPNTMVIIGASDKGLDFAVFEFLERYAGVRWLMPGTIGEYVPKNTTLSAPTQNIIEEPGFISRSISHPALWADRGDWAGPGNNELQKWAYHMRYNSQIEFHHSLANLFPPSAYAKSHPDFFPVLDGKRYLPPKDNLKTTYQLCFTNEDSVNEAVKIITQNFSDAKVNSYTYSLGINDIGDKGYCQCQTCLSKHQEDKNFLGFENYSDLYYPWVNQIAQAIGQKYPTAKIGLLAYYNVIEPPEDKQVDPHVIPYLCYEILSFIDPKAKAKNEKLLDSWNKTKCLIGWYDYAYGRQYLLPRIYPRYLAKVYKSLYDHKVRAYYSEAYPDDKFMEGPKLYVIFKVLWNPNVDVDKLIKEWCECAVGKDAAPYLVQYYDFWEEFWTKRVPETSWFKSGSCNTYLNFNSSGYLKALQENDLKMLQQLLETVSQKATPGKPKIRAEDILKSFLAKKVEIEKFQYISVELKNPKVVAELENAKFDQKKQDKWTTWQRAGSRGKFIHDSAAGHQSLGSQMIDVTGANNGPMCYMKSIPCSPNKIYRASVWTLTQGLDDGADVSLAIEWKGDSPKTKHADDKFFLRTGLKKLNTPEWQKLEITFPTCPIKGINRMSIQIGVVNSAFGKVFFDDVKLQEVIDQ